ITGVASATTGFAIASAAAGDDDVAVVFGALLLVGVGDDAGVVLTGLVTGGFLKRSGKSFGTTAPHNARIAIEKRTARKMRFSISRDGVPTSRIQRMAVREPPQSEPDAAQKAVLFDGLHHVDGAGRLEPAHRRQDRRDDAFVETEQQESDRAHDEITPRSLVRRGEARGRGRRGNPGRRPLLRSAS